VKICNNRIHTLALAHTKKSPYTVLLKSINLVNVEFEALNFMDLDMYI
jgi:hypothetical protein